MVEYLLYVKDGVSRNEVLFGWVRDRSQVTNHNESLASPRKAFLKILWLLVELLAPLLLIIIVQCERRNAFAKGARNS